MWNVRSTDYSTSSRNSSKTYASISAFFLNLCQEHLSKFLVSKIHVPPTTQRSLEHPSHPTTVLPSRPVPGGEKSLYSELQFTFDHSKSLLPSKGARFSRRSRQEKKQAKRPSRKIQVRPPSKPNSRAQRGGPGRGRAAGSESPSPHTQIAALGLKDPRNHSPAGGGAAAGGARPGPPGAADRSANLREPGGVLDGVDLQG